VSLVGFASLHFGEIGDKPKALHLRVSIHREIACPRCHAVIGSSCTSTTGRRCRAHAERIKAGAP
jgi:hypothetical protein